jgi:hypothetical protein
MNDVFKLNITLINEQKSRLLRQIKALDEILKKQLFDMFRLKIDVVFTKYPHIKSISFPVDTGYYGTDPECFIINENDNWTIVDNWTVRCEISEAIRCFTNDECDLMFPYNKVTRVIITRDTISTEEKYRQ